MFALGLGASHMFQVNGMDRFPRSRLAPHGTLSLIKILMPVHMRSRAGPVTGISIFATEILVLQVSNWAEIFPYELSSVTRTKLFRQHNFAFAT